MSRFLMKCNPFSKKTKSMRVSAKKGMVGGLTTEQTYWAIAGVIALGALALLLSPIVDEGELDALKKETDSILVKHKAAGKKVRSYTGYDVAMHKLKGQIKLDIVDETTSYTINGVATKGRIKSTAKPGCYHHLAGQAGGHKFSYALKCNETNWAQGIALGENEAYKKDFFNTFESITDNNYGSDRASSMINKLDGDGELSFEIEDLS